MELAVFDQHRRKFDNFSSLVLEWKSSNETLAHFTDAKSMQMVAKNDGSGQIRMHGTISFYTVNCSEVTKSYTRTEFSPVSLSLPPNIICPCVHHCDSSYSWDLTVNGEIEIS